MCLDEVIRNFREFEILSNSNDSVVKKKSNSNDSIKIIFIFKFECLDGVIENFILSIFGPLF
jgi:hypothetical protein